MNTEFIRMYKMYKESARLYMQELLEAEKHVPSTWQCSYTFISCPMGWSIKGVYVRKDRIIAIYNLRDWECNETYELDITDRSELDSKLADMEDHKLKYKATLEANAEREKEKELAELERLKRKYNS